jgi:hypothetical protein
MPSDLIRGWQPGRVKKTRQNKNLANLYLNLSDRRCDQDRACRARSGKFFMQTIRPDNTDPIPLRNSPHKMGTIMIRFVGLLVLAVVILALAWSH